MHEANKLGFQSTRLNHCLYYAKSLCSAARRPACYLFLRTSAAKLASHPLPFNFSHISLKTSEYHLIFSDIYNNSFHAVKYTICSILWSNSWNLVRDAVNHSVNHLLVGGKVASFKTMSVTTFQLHRSG
jgi:hypothetical protein